MTKCSKMGVNWTWIDHFPMMYGSEPKGKNTANVDVIEIIKLVEFSIPENKSMKQGDISHLKRMSFWFPSPSILSNFRRFFLLNTSILHLLYNVLSLIVSIYLYPKLFSFFILQFLSIYAITFLAFRFAFYLVIKMIFSLV